ncbi:MAG: hypothetical protein Q9219_007642 [cf. Caloplaca sp. 3 TL-2023]
MNSHDVESNDRRPLETVHTSTQDSNPQDFSEKLGTKHNAPLSLGPLGDSNGSDVSIRGPSKTDNRPRHAKTGEPLSLLREIIMVMVICLAQLMTQAGVGQALATTGITGDSLNITNPASRSWEIAAYSLTVGTFILPAGRWGDLLGHKRMFVIGFAWFGFWSILTGVSVYVDQIFFDLCRAMQGIGPAILLPNGIAILGTSYPPSPRKDMAFAMFGSVAPTGAVFGAVFASIFAQFLWWPWAYWAMAIACFIISAVAWAVIPGSPSLGHRDAMFQRLDILGSVFGVGGLVLVNVAWNQGSSIGWTTAYTYILLIFFLVLRSQTPLLTSADFIPCSISGLCAAVTAGILMSRIRHAYIMLIALLGFTIGTVLLATAPVKQTYWAQTFISMLATPWGMDLSFPAGTLILSAAMPREHQGLAASLVSTVVNYSISLGLGFAGTVESNVVEGGTQSLKGFRAALYMGIGLASLGLAVAAVFTFVTRPRLKEGKN